MIGRLSGEIVVKHPPRLMLDVNGVGYELEAPMSTFYDLPDLGQPVVLLTHLVVREDAHLLYGFARESERTLFRALLKIRGIGARMALAILSGISVDEFARCVQRGDVAMLTRLPGVGKKSAERLIMEMRDRLESVAVTGTASGGVSLPDADPVAEAVDALIALGYRPPEASRMVRAVDSESLSSEEIIRAALKAAAA